MKSFNYYWRLFATGLSFFSFGVGGLIIGLVLFPLVNLLIWNQQRRKIVSQYLIHKLFRFFIEMMRFLGIMDYQVNGLEKLRNAQGTLIVANHPTLIDVVILISFLKKVDCVVKADLMKNPVMIGPVKAANYIINSDPEKLITDCSQSLQNGNALIIFPEGTRTEPGKPFRFQRGAAGIALRSNVDITPVVMDCTPSTLTKSEKWYQIPPTRFYITLDVRDPIRVEDVVDTSLPRSVVARRLTTYLQDYFTKEVSVHD
ncbi:MAG: 1-acyl-sn-glycerol-3-phosphate acyltransferase [Ketobacteraceae bacterium]|nr:1-acyl-sn-glycerol-3-phosphate acyltransferase [Ketobacteraceae bacterium]